MSAKKEEAAAKAEEEQEAQKVQEPEETEKVSEATVYCGPTVRGVVRQYTVFTDGKLPDALTDFLEKLPAAKGLIATASEFAKMRERVERAGTAENMLFCSIQKKL